jgi:hypothetical protein
MISTPGTTQRQAWRALIQKLADEAKRTMPEAGGRLDKAVSLILMGDVDLLDDGAALVGSQTHGDRTYTVYNHRCECPDSLRTQHCKHVLAVKLMQQAGEHIQAVIDALATFTPRP